MMSPIHPIAPAGFILRNDSAAKKMLQTTATGSILVTILQPTTWRNIISIPIAKYPANSRYIFSTGVKQPTPQGPLPSKMAFVGSNFPSLGPREFMSMSRQGTECARVEVIHLRAAVHDPEVGLK